MRQKLFAVFVDIVRGHRIEASLMCVTLRALAVLPYAFAGSIAHLQVIDASAGAQVSR